MLGDVGRIRFWGGESAMCLLSNAICCSCFKRDHSRRGLGNKNIWYNNNNNNNVDTKNKILAQIVVEWVE